MSGPENGLWTCTRVNVKPAQSAIERAAALVRIRVVEMLVTVEASIIIIVSVLLIERGHGQ